MSDDDKTVVKIMRALNKKKKIKASEYDFSKHLVPKGVQHRLILDRLREKKDD